MVMAKYRIKMLLRFAGLILLFALLIKAWTYVSGEQILFDEEAPVEIIFPRLYGMGSSAIFVQGSRAVLIDAGGEGDGAYIADILTDLGVQEIAFLFLTSPGITCFGGVSDIADRLPIRQIISFRTSVYHAAHSQLQADMQRRGIPFIIPILSRQYTIGNMRFTVFPPSRHFYQNQDNHSLAVLVRHGDVRMFFAGTAAAGRTEEIIGYNLSPVNLYKIANHGRLNRASVELLEQLNPNWSIVANYLADTAIVNAALAGGEILYMPEGPFIFVSNGNELKLTEE